MQKLQEEKKRLKLGALALLGVAAAAGSSSGLLLGMKPAAASSRWASQGCSEVSALSSANEEPPWPASAASGRSSFRSIMLDVGAPEASASSAERTRRRRSTGLW